MHKVLTSPKICASTTSGDLKCQAVNAVYNVLFNESLNSHKHDWQ